MYIRREQEGDRKKKQLEMDKNKTDYDHHFPTFRAINVIKRSNNVWLASRAADLYFKPLTDRSK